MLFIILMAIVLLGLLTAAIQYSSRPEGANIDKETLLIRVTEVQRYASELERAVLFIMQNGKSESDIRFGHPDAHADYGLISDQPDRQVFDRQGGGAKYRDPPDGINDGSAWEFYAGTALPQVGSTRADLVAVLPYVTQAFCERLNQSIGQTTQQPNDTGASAASGADPGTCVQIGALGRFDAGQQFYDSPSTPNTVDESTFTVMPALQGCVLCSLDTNGANGTADEYHFYHVLYAR